MGAPIIIDDGGSTRIRRVKEDAIGEMDSLLTVDSDSGTPKSEHKLDDPDGFSQVLIVWQNKYGVPDSFTMPFQKVEITSHFGQNVTLEKSGNKLTITLSGTVMPPIVEARQHKKKRRYIVSNSGPIETVTVDGTLVYDTEADQPGSLTTLPAGNQIKKPIVYTSVVLT